MEILVAGQLSEEWIRKTTASEVITVFKNAIDVAKALNATKWNAVLTDYFLPFEFQHGSELIEAGPQIFLGAVACQVPVIGIILPKVAEHSKSPAAYEFLRLYANGIYKTHIVAISGDEPKAGIDEFCRYTLNLSHREERRARGGIVK
jgi:hypothetical protein